MIIIQVLKNESDDSQAELSCFQEYGATIIESKEFEGAQETINIMIELGKQILPYVFSFIIMRLESGKYISVKEHGKEVSGMTKDNTLDMLMKMEGTEYGKAEIQKIKAEAQRIRAEAKRIKSEARRIVAEAEKTEAEANKIKAETERIKAETEMTNKMSD